jgi:hypothetical protein
MIQKLTAGYLQALIGVKCLHGYHLVDQFEGSSASSPKTQIISEFGRLKQQIDQLEFLLCLVECNGGNFDGLAES